MMGYSNACAHMERAAHERRTAKPMDKPTADRLRQLDTRFYERYGASFSQTRRTAWAGWDGCLATLEENVPQPGEPYRVLDLACGNLRFETWLARRFPETPFTFHAVDICEPELPEGLDAAQLDFQRADLAALLDTDGDKPALPGPLPGVPPCDLAVAFGFMHHLPLQGQRESLLRLMADSLAPGGHGCVSLWRFLDVPELAARAHETTAQGCAELGIDGLEPGDCLLGWQGVPGAYRYCHSFSECEIDVFATLLQVHGLQIARFDADGRNGAMNAYLSFMWTPQDV